MQIPRWGSGYRCNKMSGVISRCQKRSWRPSKVFCKKNRYVALLQRSIFRHTLAPRSESPAIDFPKFSASVHLSEKFVTQTVINFSTFLQGSPHLCTEAGRGHVVPLCCAPFLHSFALLSTTLPMTELPGKAVEKANPLGWGKKESIPASAVAGKPWQKSSGPLRLLSASLSIWWVALTFSLSLCCTRSLPLLSSPLLSPAPFPFPSQTQSQYTAAVQSATDRQHAPHTLVCTHTHSLFKSHEHTSLTCKACTFTHTSMNTSWVQRSPLSSFCWTSKRLS